MPRLRSKQTGVVVSVDDATAARLGAEYEPVTVRQAAPEPEPKPKPVRRSPRPKK